MLNLPGIKWLVNLALIIIFLITWNGKKTDKERKKGQQRCK